MKKILITFAAAGLLAGCSTDESARGGSDLSEPAGIGAGSSHSGSGGAWDRPTSGGTMTPGSGGAVPLPETGVDGTTGNSGSDLDSGTVPE